MQRTLKPGYSLGGRLDRALHEKVEPSFEFGTDEYWMEQALLTSMNAVGWSAPNPAVGCVIVKENRELARGFTQAYRHEHAERMAFEMISDPEALRGATVYVTLEPCTHFGFQPPCIDLLLSRPVGRVVIACADPDPRVSGQGIQTLRDSDKEVVLGVLEAEARAWHFPFLKNRVTGKPVWIAKWAQNEEGFLADAVGNSKWITNEVSRAYTHWLRQKYDAILVGARTWITDRPKLTVRDCALPHRRNPVRLVFDPRAMLATLPVNEILIHEESPIFVYIERERFEAISPTLPRVAGLTWLPFKGVEGFQGAVESTDFGKPLQSIFCEGGARLLNTLMQHGIFDAVHRFQAERSFERVDSRNRIDFKPDASWIDLARHKFLDDDLHEWVKCF